MLPSWAQILIGISFVVLFILGLFAIAASPYGDWVREFYAKRDRLQTLFTNDSKKSKNSN